MLFTFLCLSFSHLHAQDYKINQRTRIFMQEVQGDSLFLKVDNDFIVPLTLEINLVLTNLEGNSTQFVAIIPEKAKGHVVARFKRQIAGQPFKYTYNWRIILGDSSKSPDPDYAYRLPFPAEANYRVSQNPGDSFSHKNTFAYDFAMPLRSPIAASRDGIVAIVKSDSNIGGADIKFLNETNFIAIYHSDGTIANYLHLDKDGVLVQEGQKVKAGELIGYSGNTGYSTGPHLHFEIVQPDIISTAKKWVRFKWKDDATLLPEIAGNGTAEGK